MTTTVEHQQLAALIARLSLRAGDFTLASGRRSTFLIDLKPSALDPLGAHLIGKALHETVARLEACDAVGCMATGGIPLVATLVAHSQATSMPLPGFYVRKSSKGHGTNATIDGCSVTNGMRVVLVEDVTTSGGSILQAAHAARARGALVNHVITVVDRLEGAAEYLAEHGLSLTSILTKDDILTTAS